ncbi:MAG: hypothetical protein QXR17_07295 [Candidatus Bathyarchaeia archaeon]
MHPDINISPEPNPGYNGEEFVAAFRYCNAIHHVKSDNIANVAGNKAIFLFFKRRVSEPNNMHKKIIQVVTLANIEAYVSCCDDNHIILNGPPVNAMLNIEAP